MLELPTEERNEVAVLGCFAPQYDAAGGRIVLGLKGKTSRRRPGPSRRENAEKKAQANGHANGEADEEGDVDMTNGHATDERIETAQATQSGQGHWTNTLAASGDGQWLAAGDVKGGVTVYNLDTMQVSRLAGFF